MEGSKSLWAGGAYGLGSAGQHWGHRGGRALRLRGRKLVTPSSNIPRKRHACDRWVWAAVPGIRSTCHVARRPPRFGGHTCKQRCGVPGMQVLSTQVLTAACLPCLSICLCAAGHFASACPQKGAGGGGGGYGGYGGRGGGGAGGGGGAASGDRPCYLCQQTGALGAAGCVSRWGVGRQQNADHRFAVHTAVTTHAAAACRSPCLGPLSQCVS